MKKKLIILNPVVLVLSWLFITSSPKKLILILVLFNLIALTWHWRNRMINLWEYIPETTEYAKIHGHDFEIIVYPPWWQPLFFQQFLTPHLIVKIKNKGRPIERGKVFSRYRLYPSSPLDVGVLGWLSGIESAARIERALYEESFDNFKVAQTKTFNVRLASSEVLPDQRYSIGIFIEENIPTPGQSNMKREETLYCYHCRPAVIVHNLYLLISIIAGIIIGLATILIQLLK